MKITTRQEILGIELKNYTVTEEIYNTSKDEIKETAINFLEVAK